MRKALTFTVVFAAALVVVLVARVALAEDKVNRWGWS
jgi:hypothetical protein